jgi:hypothetical protein
LGVVGGAVVGGGLLAAYVACQGCAVGGISWVVEVVEGGWVVWSVDCEAQRVRLWRTIVWVDQVIVFNAGVVVVLVGVGGLVAIRAARGQHGCHYFECRQAANSGLPQRVTSGFLSCC